MKTIQNQIKLGVMAILTTTLGLDAMTRGYNTISMILLLGGIVMILGFLFFSHQDVQ